MNVIKININNNNNKKKCLLYASEFYYFTVATYQTALRGWYHRNNDIFPFISGSLPNN